MANGARLLIRCGADMHDPRSLAAAQNFLRGRCSAKTASGMFVDILSRIKKSSPVSTAEIERAARGASALPVPRNNPGKPVVLLFRSLQNEAGKEGGAGRLHQATFYLASALRSAGVKVVIADVKMPESDDGEMEGLAGLDALLRANPDINIAGLTLLEGYFSPARRLAAHILSRRDCFIFLGGIMPTSHPFHTLAHFREAHFVLRGAGEEALPSAALALGGARPKEGINPRAAAALCALDGIMGRCGGTVLFGAAETVNRVSLESPYLDMSLLNRADVENGGRFSLSRGCANNCAFCTSFDKSRYHAVPFEKCRGIFDAYLQRLNELYGGARKVPALARGIGFYDDDFLGDPERAILLLEYFSKGPLYMDFAQTGIRSLHSGNAINRKLVKALAPAAFGIRANCAPRAKTDLYIGTENFCDAELARLGKGYDVAAVRRAARALSAAGIRQAHHLILCNAFTTATDILENIAQLRSLRSECGDNFAVLSPVIRALRSLEGSRSRAAALKAGLAHCIQPRAKLSLNGLPQFDYALGADDMPDDALAARLAAGAVRSLDANDFDAALEAALYEAVDAWAKVKPQTASAQRLEKLLDRYMPLVAPGRRKCRR
jgi:hypothetical protein